eukprot:2871519-Pyramimonas_sp.AAC.1
MGAVSAVEGLISEAWRLAPAPTLTSSSRGKITTGGFRQFGASGGPCWAPGAVEQRFRMRS